MKIKQETREQKVQRVLESIADLCYKDYRNYYTLNPQRLAEFLVSMDENDKIKD